MIIQKYLQSSTCLCLVAALLLLAEPTNAETSAAEKLRAAFLGFCPIERGEPRLELLERHGFNAALAADSGLDVKIPLWNAWARSAQRRGLRLFPIYTFHGTAESSAWRGTFQAYTPAGGTRLDRTPCPLDAEYWEKSVAERWEALALLSRQIPLAGLVIDTEMYGGDVATYHQPCVCDRCWQEFALAFAAADPARAKTLDFSTIPLMQREQFLKTSHIWREYTALQAQRLQAIATQIERRIHGINPALPLGFMPYVDNWFYRSLIKGFGTPAQPVIVFSETFYIRGYSSDVLAEQTAIKQSGDAQYLPGLWQGRFFPDDLPAQASQLAQQTDGYWFFTADSLWTDTPKSGDYAVHGTSADYWTAWNSANSMIRQGEAPPPTFSSVHEPTIPRLQTPPALKDLLRDVAKLPAPSPQKASDIVYVADTLFHLLTQPGSVIRLTPIAAAGQTAAPIAYRLFDSDGTLALDGTSATAVELVVPDNLTGLVSFLVLPQEQGFQVDFGAMPSLVEASVTFPLATRSSPLRMNFAILPEQAHIRFKVTSRPSEPTTIAFFSPDGIERHRLEFQRLGETRFPISATASDQQHEFWQLHLTAASAAVTRWHYFYQTPLPFLILERR